MRLRCSISNDGVSDRSGRIDSPAHKKNATALIQRSHSDSLWRLVVIGTVWRSGLAYDGCDELDATAGGLWPRSRWYCSNQPSRIMTAGRKSRPLSIIKSMLLMFTKKMSKPGSQKKNE